jgi:hypothetical protein
LMINLIQCIYYSPQSDECIGICLHPLIEGSFCVLLGECAFRLWEEEET